MVMPSTVMCVTEVPVHTCNRVCNALVVWTRVWALDGTSTRISTTLSTAQHQGRDFLYSVHGVDPELHAETRSTVYPFYSLPARHGSRNTYSTVQTL